MMKTVYTAIGLTVAGVANATPCSDQQITALGLAFLQATSCDDVKAINAPDCTEDGQAVSQNVVTMGGLCDQVGFDEFKDQMLSGGGGNSGSGGFGPQGGSGGATTCTNQQTEAFGLAYLQATSCDDIKAIVGPDCTEEGQDLSLAPASMGIMCDQMGFDDFKTYFDALAQGGNGGNNGSGGFGPQGGSGGFGPQSGSGSGSGSGSDSSEDCVGDDCCTLTQEINFVKAARDIQTCDDLDNVEVPTCKGAPPKEQVKAGCTLQGVDAFKAGLKDQEEELEKKLKDKDPSAAFGAKPLALAVVAPSLLALFFAL